MGMGVVDCSVGTKSIHGTMLAVWQSRRDVDVKGRERTELVHLHAERGAVASTLHVPLSPSSNFTASSVIQGLWVGNLHF